MHAPHSTYLSLSLLSSPRGQTDIASSALRLERSFVATIAMPASLYRARCTAVVTCSLYCCSRLARARAVFLTVAARSTGSGRRSTAWVSMSPPCGRACFPLGTTKSLLTSLRRFLLGQRCCCWCCYSRTMWGPSQRAHRKEVHGHVPGQRNQPPESSDKGK